MNYISYNDKFYIAYASDESPKSLKHPKKSLFKRLREFLWK